MTLLKEDYVALVINEGMNKEHWRNDTNHNPDDFKEDINVFDNISIWCNSNLLSLNSDKTKCLYFRPKNSSPIDIEVGYNTEINNSSQTKSRVLIIDSSLFWKSHLDHLMNKLSMACYAIRAIKHYMSQKSWRVIYSFYFQSIVSYGIIFWGTPQLTTIYLGCRKE